MNVSTLIWLFPILFIFHDFEEIIMIEKWLNKNSRVIYEKLPRKLADRVIKQFSMSTAQFAVAVLVIFLFVSSSAILANVFGSINFFVICSLVFFLHAFTHIGQSILFRSITPGAFTSVVVIIPYSIVLYNTLLSNEVISWKLIFICLPLVFLIIPVALIAHWIGRKIA